MRIVEVERMSKRAIEQRRARRGVARRIAKHSGGAVGEAHRGYRGEQGWSNCCLAARAYDAADEVEQKKGRALYNFRRKGSYRDGGTEIRQGFRDFHHLTG
ncbi:hypothetical protein TomTYG45_33830 [Sphingobium sp. TomTYG45]